MRDFFKKSENLIAFSVGLIPTIFTMIYKPKVAVPFYVCFILIFITAICIWQTFILAMKLKDMKKKKVLSIVSLIDGRCICYHDGLLTTNAIVEFFTVYDDYERRIGYGRVEIINQKGLAQIIPYSHDENVDICDYIRSHLSTISIKPLPVLADDFKEALQ